MNLLTAYLFLIICSVSLCGMSLLRKQYARTTGESVPTTLVFMALYSIFVIVVCMLINALGGQAGNVFTADGFTLAVSGVLSVTVTVTTVICIIGTAYGSISILVLFADLGQLVLSVAYGFIFDKSRNVMTPQLAVGLVLSAVVLLLSAVGNKKEENGEKANRRFIFNLLCFIVFFTNGIVLICYNLMTTYRPAYTNMSFISLYSFFAIIVCLIAFVFVKGGSAKKQILKNGTGGKNLLYIFIYAAFFALGEILSLINTTLIPISVQAPLSFAITTFVLALGDSLIYKTRLSAKETVQLVLAVICSICFAI